MLTPEEIHHWYRDLLQQSQECGFVHGDEVLTALGHCLLATATGTDPRGLLLSLDYAAYDNIHQLSFVIERMCQTLFCLSTSIVSITDKTKLQDVLVSLLIRFRGSTSTMAGEASVITTSAHSLKSHGSELAHSAAPQSMASGHHHHHRSDSLQQQQQQVSEEPSSSASKSHIDPVGVTDRRNTIRPGGYSTSMKSGANISVGVPQKRVVNVLVLEMLDIGRTDIVRGLLEVFCDKQLQDGGMTYPFCNPFMFVVLAESRYAHTITRLFRDRLFYGLQLSHDVDRLPNLQVHLWKRPTQLFVPDYEALAKSIERHVHLSADLHRFVQDIITSLRSCRYTIVGIPPRATVDLILISKIASAMLYGRHFVTCECVTIMGQFILRHRLDDRRSSHVDLDRLLQEVFIQTPKPR